MQKLFGLALSTFFLFPFVSCSNDTDENEVENTGDFIEDVIVETPEKPVFKSTLVTSDYKSYSHRWSRGDDFWITDGTHVAKFNNIKYYDQDGVLNHFNRVDGEKITGGTGNVYYYLHPHDVVDHYISEGRFKVNLPDEQYFNLTPGATLPESSCPKVGVSTTTQWYFYNLTCALLVRLSADKGNILVKSIELSSDENLSGLGTVTTSLSGKASPTLAMDAVSGIPAKVTLNCGEGVLVSSDKQTYFYISIPYGTHNNLKFVINTDKGSQYKVFPSASFSRSAVRGTNFAFTLLQFGGDGELGDVAD